MLMKMKIVKFDHHGAEVSAMEHLKGKHREHCLCFQCDKFKFNREENCKIANLLFSIDLQCEITTPVFYCAEFVEGEDKKESDKTTKEITVKWGHLDVKGIADEMNTDISDEEIGAVLDLIKRTHDAEIGITWETIRCGIREIKNT